MRPAEGCAGNSGGGRDHASSKGPLPKAFEESYLKPADAAIKAKDRKKFGATWNNRVEGCNACHMANGFSTSYRQDRRVP